MERIALYAHFLKPVSELAGPQRVLERDDVAGLASAGEITSSITTDPVASVGSMLPDTTVSAW